MSDISHVNTDTGAAEEINQQLLHSAVKLNTLLLAGVFGCFSGLIMFVMTYMSMYRGMDNPGQYLNLLGVFLPGYSVSHAGAWIGLFWGACIGALLAAMFYRIYARSIPSQVEACLRHGHGKDDLLDVTLRFDGNYLGLALGTIVSLGLLVSTSWLVFRGTADESDHAELLSQYLPGYTVSYVGGIVGALEIFAIIYLLSLLLSWIYNRVTLARGRNPL
jgi:hypothetical protein